MSYPVIGAEGAVTSWGSTNFYSVLLAAMRPTEAKITMSSSQITTTPLNTGVDSFIPGLKQWEATLSGHAFATPILGNQAVVAWSSGGYSANVESFSVEIQAPVFDYTSLNTAVGGTVPTWRSFRPGASSWSATVTARIDNTTAIPYPDAAGATAPTVTFTYQDDATDEKLSGTAWIESVEPSIVVGSMSMVTMKLKGTGALTPAGDGSPFGTTALGIPLWSQGGAAAGALVVTAATGRTYSGADSFWKSLNLSCNIGESVKIVVGVQGTGALTIA